MKQLLKRQKFLKAAGLSLALPYYASQAGDLRKVPKKLFTIVNHLSFHQPSLIPKEKGENLKKPVLFECLDGLNATLISQLNNPGVQIGNGHTPSVGILSGFFNRLERKNKISFDQVAASHLSSSTRYSSVLLQAGQNSNFSQVCWDKHGLPIRQESNVQKVFNQLFGKDFNSDFERHKLEKRLSLLDSLKSQRQRFSNQLNTSDRQNLDEYLTSLRELELRVQKQLHWVDQPKPVCNNSTFSPFPAVKLDQYLDNMLDLSRLSLQSDSTRVVTLQIPFWTNFKCDVAQGNYHNMSHHGSKPESIQQLIKVEGMILTKLKHTLLKMKEFSVNESNLLNQTTCVVTAPMGSASAHNFNQLPAIIMGGDYKHGKNIFAKGASIKTLYLRLLRDLGVKVDHFNQEKTIFKELV